MCCLPNKFPLPIFLIINKCNQIDNMRKTPWIEKSQLDTYVKENQFFDNFFVSNQAELTREQIFSNQLVDFEVPLKCMINSLFKFKDLKEKFINMTAIQNSKDKDNKIITDSSYSNTSSLYGDLRVVDKKRKNSKTGLCVIF
jgi:hypothetical protein